MYEYTTPPPQIKALDLPLGLVYNRYFPFPYFSLEKDVCHGNPCKNGGSCKDVEGVASCSCPESFEGAFCQRM